jgi:hypothetical protein
MQGEQVGKDGQTNGCRQQQPDRRSISEPKIRKIASKNLGDGRGDKEDRGFQFEREKSLGVTFRALEETDKRFVAQDRHTA